jgi:hypothetical protein
VRKITTNLLKPKPKLDERGKVLPTRKGHIGKRVTEAQKSGSWAEDRLLEFFLYKEVALPVSYC